MRQGLDKSRVVARVISPRSVPVHIADDVLCLHLLLSTRPSYRCSDLLLLRRFSPQSLRSKLLDGLALLGLASGGGRGCSSAGGGWLELVGAAGLLVLVMLLKEKKEPPKYVKLESSTIIPFPHCC